MDAQTLAKLLEDPETFVRRVADRAARDVLEGNSPQPRDWLTERELAELWGCSQDTIRSYAFRAENPLPYGTVGELRRYHRADFDEWTRAEGERDRRRRLEAKKRGQEEGLKPAQLKVAE